METEDAIKKLNALAQETRLEVFRLLARHGEQGLSAGDISEQTSIQPNTLSFHLKELSNAGLIRSERQGRSIIYSLEISGMSSLVQFITEDCCQGRPELCNPNKGCC